jgi:hypothetical protein
MNPGADTDTVVVPGETPLNSTPPFATEVGERESPAETDVATVALVSVSVCNIPIEAWELVAVTVTPGDPGRNSIAVTAV